MSQPEALPTQARAMRPHVLRADREHVVARGALGVTMYLANGLAWAREGALAAFDVWLGSVARSEVRWYATSVDERWHSVEKGTVDALRSSISLPWARGRARHGLRLRVSDGAGAPGTAFVYRELDEERAPCAGYVQAFVPADTPVAVFERMARAMLSCGLVWWASAGLVATESPSQRPSSFGALRAMCRRYAGLDVQVPDATAWRARDGLASVAWLTVLGAPFTAARAPERDAIARATPGHGVIVSSAPDKLWVFAGEEPLLGDLNELAYPHAYAEAAHLLQPFLAEKAADFPTWEPGATGAWRRRFLEPEAWT